MINTLFEKLKNNNLSISAAESVTGGKFSSLIVSKNGASSFFKGSFICYSNEFKYNILNVREDIKIISHEMASELSIKSRELSKANISISFTGNSSKNGIEMKPKGLVYIAISNSDTMKNIKYVSKENTREKIIDDISNKGIKFLLEFIEKNY